MSPTKIEASFMPTNADKEIKMIDFSADSLPEIIA